MLAILNKALSLPLSLVLMSALPSWAASNNEDISANEDAALNSVERLEPTAF